jgi:hypothetical protein
MKSRLSVFFILFFLFASQAQERCESSFTADTLTPQGDSVALQGESVEAALKNLGTVKFFKAGNDKLYMRIEVTENFYFNMVDILEIQSGTKSYYAKNTKQFKVNRSRGRFTIEIFRNYVWTLKDLGITAIVFGKATTEFSRQDTKEIRKMAACMFDAITDRK